MCARTGRFGAGNVLADLFDEDVGDGQIAVVGGIAIKLGKPFRFIERIANL
jgi:hypothetical protein